MELIKEYDKGSYVIKGNPCGCSSQREEYLNFILRNSRVNADVPKLFKSYMENKGAREVTNKYLLEVMKLDVLLHPADAQKDVVAEREFFQEFNIESLHLDILRILGTRKINSETAMDKNSYRRLDKKVKKVLKASGYTAWTGNVENYGKPEKFSRIITLQEMEQRVAQLKQFEKEVWQAGEIAKAKKEAEAVVEAAADKVKQEQWIKEHPISFICSECGKEMCFPNLPDGSENTPEWKLATKIYNKVWENLTLGKTFCQHCQNAAEAQGGWRKDKIQQEITAMINQANQIEQLKTQGFFGVEINFADFCKQYRYDKCEQKIEEIKKVLKGSVGDEVMIKFFTKEQGVSMAMEVYLPKAKAELVA